MIGAGAYVLFLMALLEPTGSPRPIAISQDFLSKETCEAAKESIRQKSSSARIVLLTCEKK